MSSHIVLPSVQWCHSDQFGLIRQANCTTPYLRLFAKNDGFYT